MSITKPHVEGMGSPALTTMSLVNWICFGLIPTIFAAAKVTTVHLPEHGSGAAKLRQVSWSSRRIDAIATKINK